jgi:hypothetical protein
VYASLVAISRIDNRVVPTDADGHVSITGAR